VTRRALRPWVARLLAAAVLLQAGMPNAVAACQRASGDDGHGCGYCQAGPARGTAPGCHATRQAAHERSRTAQACCLLNADPACGLEAMSEPALRAPEVAPVALAAIEPAAVVCAFSGLAPFEFPPGSPRATGGPPATILLSILRL
jgi:hypothetical protein